MKLLNRPGFLRVSSLEHLLTVQGRRWAIEDSFRNSQEQVRPRPKRDPLLAWLASPSFARHTRFRQCGHQPSRQRCAVPKTMRDAKLTIDLLVDPGNPPRRYSP